MILEWLLIIAIILIIINLILLAVFGFKAYELYRAHMGDEVAKPRFLEERDHYWRTIMRVWLKEAYKENPEAKLGLIYVINKLKKEEED